MLASYYCLGNVLQVKTNIVLLLLMVLAMSMTTASAENWPAWRGPRGDGTSSETNVPTTWDATTGEGIAWKVPVPGQGHSSPIVWDDSIFVASQANN